MNDAQPEAKSHQPMSRRVRVDKACDDFERQWRAGENPRIESFLADAEADDREHLLRELIAVDLMLRNTAGQKVDPAEYHDRFVENGDIVDSAVESFRSRETKSIKDDAVDSDQTPPLRPSPDKGIPTTIGRNGRYQVLRVLGQGGFACVYLARDTDLDREVAIKVPRLERFNSERELEFFVDEARKVAQLDHTGIVRVLDVQREPNLVYIVQQYINGGDLTQHTTANRLPYQRLAELMISIAEAVGYAHSRGYVHLDLKPANILVDSEGVPFVADFGLALHESTQSGMRGRILGTYAYMSPAQTRGEAHRLDGRADIWSLGVILYELLTGRRPFTGKTRPELVDQIEHHEPRPPRQIDPAIPPELSRICLVCLAKQATDRYPSTTDLIDDLRHWLRDEPTAAATFRGEATSEDSVTPSSAQVAKVVPQGLRSFGAEHADFYLQLLPGPHDREGIPKRVRIWKSQIEKTDSDETFPVGVMYGPSGCGKSSLVKAALIPRLADHLLSVYVEATAADTEVRLIKALRKRCPELPAEASLPDMIARLRQNDGSRGRKILIVLDQFEQWLHAHEFRDDSQLIPALRHCDGGSVQCVVMVRDDFWMSVTRFMKSLEVPLSEGHNSEAVDVFDRDHAMKVLLIFGQAYDKLPEPPNELSDSQSRFLSHAVDGLADDGKVICVRLAVFAEMMKGRDWTEKSLSEVGGTEGIGVTFLEETFSARTAPPSHRLHQNAVRAVLRELLPDQGADIKGQMKSYQKLLEASEYGRRRDDFDAVLGILDGEVRLITPTEPDQSTDLKGDISSDRDARYYQLTHDFLVPSIRQWLTQKQQETRRGRAELRLAERSALWNAKPENRHLPSLAEWGRIRTLTDTSKWTTPQRKMMKRAAQVLGFRAASVASVTAVLLIAGIIMRGRAIEANNEQRAAGLVTALVNAEVAQVPGILKDLADYRTWADPKLRTALDQYGETSRSRLNLSLGLLASDPDQVRFLKQRLLRVEPRQVETIASLLADRKSELLGDLWGVLDTPNPDHDPHLLHAASALAKYDPDNDQKWTAVAPRITSRLVNENSLRLAIWIELLRPVRKHLVPPLADVFRASPGDRSQSEIDLATDVLEKYAADDLEQLSELVLDANPKQFVSLFDALQSHGDAAIANLDREINRVLIPRWDDSPLDAAWTEPPDEVVQRIRRAAGMITERFAFCQTLPLSEFQEVADRLGKSGYRPVRLRPYAREGTVQVAAAWTRDGRISRVETEASVDSILEKDATQAKDGFVAVDVAGYLGEQDGQPAELYAAVWAERQSDREETRIYVGVPSGQHKEAYGDLENAGYKFQQTLQGFRGLGGNQLYCGVKSKSGGDGSWSWNQTVAELDGKLYPDKIHWDIDPSRAAAPETTKQRNENALADAEAKLMEDSGDLSVRFARGKASFYLGQNEHALADMGHLVQHAPGFATSFLYRSILYSRLGDADAARADLQHFAERDASEAVNAYLDVIVSAYLGDEAEAVKNLELLIEENPDKDGTLYDSACAYSVASAVYEEQDVTKAKLYADRAVGLLARAIEAGYSDYSHIQEDPDLDPLRDHDGYLELMRSGNLGLRYTAVWKESTRFESKESHGLSPEKHLEQCREFQDRGYRMVSVSAASIDGGIVTASVWHRPEVSREARERLARRQANAATALARLSHHDKLLPALRVTDDPESLTQFVHRCRAEGITPVQLLACLALADRNRQSLTGDALRLENRVLFGLLLALGEFSLDEISNDKQQPTVDRIVAFYRDDPSSTIHGATGWLLRRWGRDDLAREVDEVVRPYDPDREWFTLSIDADRQTFYQTYVVIPPGQYTIGSPGDDRVRESDEPLNRVQLSRPVAILDREITRGEYEASGDSVGGIDQYSPTPEHPMVATSWYDSVQFCRWLTLQAGFSEADQAYPDPSKLSVSQYPRDADTGLPKNWPVRLDARGFRLPTEAEWEIAARAGMRTMYSFGGDETLLDQYGWFQNNSERQTHVAKELRPNLGGLFDMHGNVWEWCHDWFGSYPLGRMRVNPVGSSLGSNRVNRGGGWNYDAAYCRTAYRSRNRPTNRSTNNGLRVALVPFAPVEQVAEPESEGPEGASGAATGEAERSAELDDVQTSVEK